jgi:glyoxylase-like metal-dependent hydrolase (beta-lactamase superfamily II)
VVWFTGSKVVHLGDLYFQLGYPYVDTGSGGDVEGLIAGLKRLRNELPADVKLIPGHGKMTDLSGLDEYLSMLQAIVARVKEQRARGHDVDAMMAAGVTKDYDARWGGFEFVPPRNFVASVVASLEN